jgi:hypothetical protein
MLKARAERNDRTLLVDSPKGRRFAAWEQSELFTEEGCVPIAPLTISERRAPTWVCAVLSKPSAATIGRK